jgi:small subunit ribosomal protein S20
MTNTKSAAKRARQSIRNASRNASVLSTLRTQQKKLLSAATGGDKATIHKVSIALSSLLDKAAKQGVIHRNLANRKKSLASSKSTHRGDCCQ